MSSRRFDQDYYIRLTHTFSEDVFRTSSRGLDQNQYIPFGDTSSRRSQDVFKTSSGRLENLLPRRLEYVFKGFLRCLAKASSRHVQDVLQRRLQNVFETSWKYVFKTSSRRLQDTGKGDFCAKGLITFKLLAIFGQKLRRTWSTGL